MRRNKFRVVPITLFTFLLAIIFTASACQEVDTPHSANPSASPATSNSGKIAVTTKSEEARKEFLAGRDLADKLRITDSLEHFDKAIALDPEFALAQLNRATSSPTAKEFFDHLKLAVNYSGKASDGERMLIEAAEAGANGNLPKQKETLEKLVAAFPNDERAHFALGNYYFGQQDYPQAISHYKRATELAPDYSTAFNILGYAYRQNENYSEAEAAFKKYVELIPKDPNPYDSYAELLLKMGRYDESIAQYRKALEVDPNFVNSYFGIAADLMYQGKYDEAATELQKLTEKARNDGERRTALIGQMAVAADRGNLQQALAEVDKQYALGQKSNDVPAMAGDQQLKGNILLEMGKVDDAQKAYEAALKLNSESNVSQDIKDNAALFHHYNLARVAIARKDLAAAKSETDIFQKGADQKKNSFLIKQGHELLGRIALQEKNYDTAIAELNQSNQQNPASLFLLGEAYKGKGDADKAKDFFTKAAKFNSLPQLPYALVRTKAQKSLAT